MFERGRDAAAGVTGHITHTLGFAGTFQQTAADKAINLVDACVTVPLALTYTVLHDCVKCVVPRTFLTIGKVQI